MDTLIIRICRVNNMENIYGSFTKEQIVLQKKLLHNTVHKLLYFKEDGYNLLDKYFTGLLYKISGLNELFGFDAEIVNLMSLLQSAKTESNKDICDFDIYRKLILDAHTSIDNIKEGD